MTHRVHREGEVFTQSDFVQWVTLAPMRGDVLVVDLGTSSYQSAPQTLGYFLVLEVQLIPGTGTLAQSQSQEGPVTESKAGCTFAVRSMQGTSMFPTLYGILWLVRRTN